MSNHAIARGFLKTAEKRGKKKRVGMSFAQKAIAAGGGLAAVGGLAALAARLRRPKPPTLMQRVGRTARPIAGFAIRSGLRLAAGAASGAIGAGML